MRSHRVFASRLIGCCAAAVLLWALSARAEPGDLKCEAQLIWGTNEASSPNPKHKPVAPELEEKLKNSPFKWEHYFEVRRERFIVPLAKEKTVPMSKNCEIRVKNLGDSQVELRLFGKGKQVSKITQALPKDQLLITGGNAENSTAWFVVLKQAD